MPKKETSLINPLFQRNFFKNLNVSYAKLGIVSGADPDILKRSGTLCRPSWWSTKEILSFRWSKKAKTTSETIRFWQNISISIFKCSPFLYTIKVCQSNLIRFSKFVNALIKKRKKLMQLSMRKEKLRKARLCFITGGFIKSFNMIINHFFVLQAHSQPNFCFLISGWRKKYQKGKKGTSNS